MWYVIQVRTGKEHDILTMYNRRIKAPDEELFIVRCIRYIRNPGGGFHEQEANAFPGYIFADTENIENLIERLRKIPDLTKVLGAGEDVFPIYKEEEEVLQLLMLGYHSQIILSGRRINDDMGKYCAENCVKNLISADKNVRNAKVAILGFTFKENCPDTRNTKIIDIVNELKEYGITPIIADSEADATEAKMLYGVEFVDMDSIKDMDAVILAVAHTEFSNFTVDQMNKFFGEGKKVLLDLKGLLNRKEYEAAGYSYWRL